MTDDDDEEANYDLCPFHPVEVQYLPYDKNCELDPSLVHKLDVVSQTVFLIIKIMVHKSVIALIRLKGWFSESSQKTEEEQH